MRGNDPLRLVLGLVMLCGLATSALSGAQTPRGTAQVVAVRAGRLFDVKTGTNLANQVVLIRGDRIADVGPANRVQIPSDARVIDLSQATVLPGLIDGHVHITDAAATPAQAARSATDSLKAGFTTQVTMGSHGGKYMDVELRNEIDSGKVQGPRLLPAGPVLGTNELPAKGPDAFRAGVRDLHDHGADHVKIMMTGAHSYKPNGEMENEAITTAEEIKAAVEEAHRLNMFVAVHAYGGDGLKSSIAAGVDDIQHAMGADDADIQALLKRNLPITSTILDLRQDEPGDLKKYQTYSAWRTQQQMWIKMMKAGVRLGFGSGATPVTNGRGRIFNEACQCSHGVQGEMFPVLVKWGATPAYTLRMATAYNAEILHKQDSLGAVDKGKFADLIAVTGDPLRDITEMQRVKFVMKGGEVVKNDLTPSRTSAR